MFQKLDEVEKRYDEITKKISDPEVIAQQSQWQTFMKEHAEIEPVVLKYREYKKAKQAIEDAKEMLKDPEMKELAEIEIEENKEKLVGEGVGFERIRRITGYLVGTVDRFNNGKRAEERDRVKHGTEGLLSNK